MLADIKAGRITRVIVKDMSRFGRDYLQVGMFTEIMFPNFGVHFIAINDDVDSEKGDNEFTPFRNIINEIFSLSMDKQKYRSKAAGNAFSKRKRYKSFRIREKKWVRDDRKVVPFLFV